MRILVTGANGFIGSVVVRKLVASGRVVRCLVRRTSNTSRIDGLQFEPQASRFLSDLAHNPDNSASGS